MFLTLPASGEEEVGRSRIAKLEQFASQDKTKAKIYHKKVIKMPSQVSDRFRGGDTLHR